jgi:glycine hydroxymethyltransferase
VLTNKYAEGYPGKRYYGGCDHVDVVEQLAIDRAKALFGADHANVQPHAGSQANIAVYTAMLNHGDKILTMRLSDGGHLTHGSPVNFSGINYEVVHYGVSPTDGKIDYEELAAMAEKEKPKMITVGASAYPRSIDFAKMGEIARSVGALLMADIAHIAGLVAAGEHPNPVPHADFVTTTTHKTLRGPRGGLIMCKAEHAKAIDMAVFPMNQGGPLMHIIAAKAVCFKDAATDTFKKYQHQIVLNAAALAKGLIARGFDLLSGGTDNHLMVLDFRKSHPELSGLKAQRALDLAHITTSRSSVPGDTRKPYYTSGLRLGSPAVTTRGMGEAEMDVIAEAISLVLNAPEDEGQISAARDKMIALAERFPLPYKS